MAVVHAQKAIIDKENDKVPAADVSGELRRALGAVMVLLFAYFASCKVLSSICH